MYWATGFYYYTFLWLVKISFLSTYFRVVRRKWVRKVLYAASVYCAIAYVGCVLTHGLWCQPLSMNCAHSRALAPPPPLTPAGNLAEHCTPWYDATPLWLTTALNVSSDLARRPPPPPPPRAR